MLEATGGWMINGVCVFLVYLRVHVYMCMCVRVHAFECLCVQNVFVTTLARSQLKCWSGYFFQVQAGRNVHYVQIERCVYVYIDIFIR